MDEKQLNNNVPAIDSELSTVIHRLNSLRVDLSVGVYGSFDTAEKDEDRPKLEPSLRTLADKTVDIGHLLSDIETLCSKIRSSTPLATTP